jgi:hypothetical protein
VPSLALAGAAAVLAAVAVLPRVLPSDGGDVPPGAARTTAAPASPAASASRTPTPSGVVDLATVWPYGSRREGGARADADVAAGRYPDLRDPEATAVDFVGSFVNPDGLTAAPLGAYEQGLRMLVSRDGRPVSTVFLVRVRIGDDAPYAVVNATRAAMDPPDSLTLDPPPPVRTTDAVTVGGTIRADGAEPTVIVELRSPGQDEALAQTTVPVTGGTGRWSGVLTPLRAPATTGVVAAWTADADGDVLEFVASPTR